MRIRVPRACAQTLRVGLLILSFFGDNRKLDDRVLHYSQKANFHVILIIKW